MVEFILQRFNAKAIRAHHDELSELLHNVVNNGASVSFVPPISLEVAQDYWQKIANEVLHQERYVLGALVEARVVGCVHLSLVSTPNGLHRAEVQKMLVHTDYRRQGIARALMRAIEDLAVEIGRTLLVLDTERGNSAVLLYEQLGWQRVGIIPHFALLKGELVDTVVFYKEV